MALRFLLDEHMRGPLWEAIQAHNRAGNDVIDMVRVGDPKDLPLTSKDAAILAWCEREGRILVSFDVRTLPDELLTHVQAGGSSPGILFIRGHRTLAEIVEYLATLAHASEPGEWADTWTLIPQ
jgi:hypothetical protein